MMKKSFILSILAIMMASMLSFGFTACGSDDETNGNGSISSKRISKIIEEEGGSIYESTFSYDSQGRVIKIIGTESSSGTNSYSEKTYQYGETVIVTKEEEKGTWSNGQSFTHTESHSYTLNNGLIIKDEEKQNSSSMTATYSYDANGYLASISEKGSNISSNKENVIWINGNITSIGDRTYEYSNIPWIKGFPFYLKGSNTDAYLFSMGYYGNVPKNLPSRIYVYDGWTYDYTVQNNLITKIVGKPVVEDNKHTKTTATIIWE